MKHLTAIVVFRMAQLMSEQSPSFDLAADPAVDELINEATAEVTEPIYRLLRKNPQVPHLEVQALIEEGIRNALRALRQRLKTPVAVPA